VAGFILTDAFFGVKTVIILGLTRRLPLVGCRSCRHPACAIQEGQAGRQHAKTQPREVTRHAVIAPRLRPGSPINIAIQSLQARFAQSAFRVQLF